MTSTDGSFCDHASVMFDGFQSTMAEGGTCVKLFFQPWVLNSQAKYIVALIGIVLSGIFLEWFGEWRESLEEVRHFISFDFDIRY
jgi:copper transporter 1